MSVGLTENGDQTGEQY